MNNLYIDLLNAVKDRFYKDNYGEVYKVVGINCHPERGLILSCLKQLPENKNKLIDFPLNKETLMGLEQLTQSEQTDFPSASEKELHRALARTCLKESCPISDFDDT